MAMLIIEAEGVSPGVIIWPIKMQDPLGSVVSTVGEEPVTHRHEAELARMSLPSPRAGQRPMDDKENTGNKETKGRIVVTSSSPKYLEYLDFMDSSIVLAKMKHRRWQKVCKVD